MPRHALPPPLAGCLIHKLRAVRARGSDVARMTGAAMLRVSGMVFGQPHRSTAPYRTDPCPMAPIHRRFAPEPA